MSPRLTPKLSTPTWLLTNSESLQRGGSRAQRPGRSREGHEERVALRVDLDATIVGKRLPKDATMLGERLRVMLAAELPQEPSRALDVRKEEGDRAAR